ncbi:MAG: response regulator [Deltaproteobacteria bacterium]|nr:response regulator [Deltaproteobacteria bacterium]
MKQNEFKGTILVVDDDKDVGDFLVYALEKFGHRPIAVYGGRDAVAAMEKKAFDIVITDLVMPDIDGLGVLRAANRIKQKPTVLMISGFSTIKAAVEAIRQGAYDFIPKPLHVHKLNDIIQRAMTRQQLVSRIESQKSKASALSLSLPVWLMLGVALALAVG